MDVEPRRHIGILDDVAALGMQQVGVAPARAEALQHRHAVGGVDVDRPGPLHVDAVIRQRPDHGQPAAPLQRQHPVVLQQHQAFDRRLARQRHVGGPPQLA